MPHSALRDYQKSLQELRKNIVDEKKHGTDVTELLKAEKAYGKYVSTCKTLDAAMKAKDPQKIQEAWSDFNNFCKSTKGLFDGLNAKLQRAGNREAAGVAGSCSASIFTMQAILKSDVDKELVKHEGGEDRLPLTSFSGDWQAAKKMFEGLTGKKKPSKTFLGKIRRSTNLEKATAAMDLASKKNDLANFEKAFAYFDKVAKEYFLVVKDAAAVDVKENETDIPDELDEAPDYDDCLKTLLKQLNIMRRDAQKVISDAK